MPSPTPNTAGGAQLVLPGRDDHEQQEEAERVQPEHDRREPGRPPPLGGRERRPGPPHELGDLRHRPSHPTLIATRSQ